MTKWINSFLTQLAFERGLSPLTQSAYEEDLNLFVSFLRDHYQIDSFRNVTRGMIAAFLEDQRKLGHAVSTRRRRLVTVRVFFSFLEQEEAIESNPASVLASPSMGRRLPHVVSEAEVRQLLESILPNNALAVRDRAMLEVLYACGLRVSELIRLTLGDLRLEEGLVRCLGKGKKERVVPIGKVAIDWVYRYIETARGRFLKKNPNIQTLFLSRLGRGLSRQTVFVMLEKRARAAGIASHLSPHVLRHCFASHLLAHGAQIRAIQEMLGHADISTTQIYTHLDAGKLARTHALFHPRH